VDDRVSRRRWYVAKDRLRPKEWVGFARGENQNAEQKRKAAHRPSNLATASQQRLRGFAAADSLRIF
jgi:hypothetical protein